MIKRLLFVYAAIIFIAVNFSQVYGIDKVNSNIQDEVLKFIKDNVYFSRGLELISRRQDDQSGIIKFRFEKNIKPFQSLDIYYDVKNKKIDYIDYYVDVFTSGNMNLPVKYSKDEAVNMACNAVKLILGPNYIFSNCINDDGYIDSFSSIPYIYKFIFKKTVNSIPVDSKEITIYIDSYSGDVVRFFAKNLVDDTNYQKTDSIKIKKDDAVNLYKRYFKPQLIYYRDYKDDFPKYKVGYVAALNSNMYGIDSENGNVVDFNGEMIRNDILELNISKANLCSNTISGITALDKAKNLVHEFAKKFNIDDTNLIQLRVIDKYYLTGRTAYVLNWNLTKKNDKIININVAVDIKSGMIIQQSFNYWNYKEDSDDKILSSNMAIDYIEKHFYDVANSLIFLKHQVNGIADNSYIFYRKYNGAVILDNYISIKIDKNDIIKNISMNWTDINILMPENIIGYNEVLNIFVSSGLKMRYIITDGKKGKLIYVPQSIDYIIDAKTGEKIFYNSFLNHEE